MKRILPIVLAVVLLAGAVTSVAAAKIAYGDLTDDGDINNRDLALLQQYINGWDVDADMTASDVNGDGDVNNRDLALLQQYINGWDVELGPEVPPVELPAVGYDFDGRGRILVESIEQDRDTVTVVAVNTSDKWITEETSYVQYVCTDAEGNVLTLDDKFYGSLFFGMMDVGQSVTLTFILPEGTAKVEFGDCRIVYWSRWIK